MNTIVAVVALVVLSSILFIIWFNLRGRRNERTLERDRGAQTSSQFASLFETEAERYAAEQLYPRIQCLTFTGRLPLRREDSLTDAPLSIHPDDIYFEIEELFTESGICASLNPEAAEALSRASTIGELVASVAVFVEQQVLPQKHNHL